MRLCFLRILGLILLTCNMTVCWAQAQSGDKVTLTDPYVHDMNSTFPAKNSPRAPTDGMTSKINNQAPISAVEEREEKEDKIPPNYFAITLYKPTYILPYYYTVSPDNPIYQNNTPNGESLKHSEVKYQLSFKVPAWKNIFHRSSSLYFAYTQLSYWQLYNQYAFFRETDYEPELFLANEINVHVTKHLHIDFLNLGATHQSNGFGNSLERSWNRLYLEIIASTDNWMLSIKPWYILHDSNFNRYNPDMATFAGYGRFIIAYKHNGHVFSLAAHNLIEKHARSATGELAWTFPITAYLKGYVQVFSGYGQSLIEYNHRTNSAGIGIALNDWI